MQGKASSKKVEGLGVSTGESSPRGLARRSCSVGLVRSWAKAPRQSWFRAAAFRACVLSLLLHLQRKYLGYFCRGDVTVWPHEHLHGFGEVRAAGTSPRAAGGGCLEEPRTLGSSLGG